MSKTTFAVLAVCFLLSAVAFAEPEIQLLGKKLETTDQLAFHTLWQHMFVLCVTDPEKASREVAIQPGTPPFAEHFRRTLRET